MAAKDRKRNTCYGAETAGYTRRVSRARLMGYNTCDMPWEETAPVGGFRSRTSCLFPRVSCNFRNG